MKAVTVDLAGSDPSAADGQQENVEIAGNAGTNQITVSIVNGELVITGLSDPSRHRPFRLE